ncbi:hypothetical protein BDZ89DRAFT_1179830 [Hymenopellis radicata]|nr:hypothetical protein BDZ89DRAFT_1179830 [Hymenopellis radicata]
MFERELSPPAYWWETLDNNWRYSFQCCWLIGDERLNVNRVATLDTRHSLDSLSSLQPSKRILGYMVGYIETPYDLRVDRGSLGMDFSGILWIHKKTFLLSLYEPVSSTVIYSLIAGSRYSLHHSMFLFFKTAQTETGTRKERAGPQDVVQNKAMAQVGRIARVPGAEGQWECGHTKKYSEL